jgi:glycosyltransferase involved in cell wall biosynthesis
MNSSHPLLTIVIPTKDRYHCLEYTIDIVLTCYSNVEIIILDSSIINPPSSLLELLKDSKIKYIKTPISFNGVENFNEGIKYINGDFVCFIGDDDIITNDIGDIVNYLHKNNIDSAISTFPINYNWPGFKSKLNSTRLSGTLVIREYNSKYVEIDLFKEKAKVINLLVSGPLNLPRIYLGIVSTSLIKRIQYKYGEIFGGVSPDIYSSFLLASEANKCMQFDLPFIIPGAYITSTSATAASGKHTSGIKNNDHTGRFPEIDSFWNYNVPFIYTCQTVWSFSLIEAYKKVNNSDVKDYSSLYASLLPHVKEFYNEIIFSFNKCNKEKKIRVFLIFFLIFKNYFFKFYNFFFKKKILIISNLQDSKSGLNYYLKNY